MSCSQWENDIALYAGGDLVDSRAVEAHLAGCPACAALAGELGGLRGELRTLPTPSAVEVARVVARVRAERPGRRWGWWWVAAAAAAVMVVVAVVSRRTNERPVVVEQVVKSAQPLPGGRGSVARPVRAPKSAARRARRPLVHARGETADVVMRLETDDPDVVFYLSLDSKGEQP